MLQKGLCSTLAATLNVDAIFSAQKTKGKNLGEEVRKELYVTLRPRLH